MIVGTPRPSWPTIQPSAPRKLRLARRVGDIAHLALEPDDLQRVLRPVWPPAGNEKTREAARRLGQHEKRVAHRRRDEELVADEFVSLARALDTHWNRPRGIGAHVRAALLLGHRHADRHALLLIGGDVARIVDAGLNLRQPLRGEVSLQFETGRRGEGHGDRTAVAGLDLGVHVGARGSRHMRAFARIGPGRRMKPVLDRGFHQRVIGGMEADEIDAPPVSIVGVEFGRVLIRQRSQLQKFGRPGPGPEGSERIAGPARAFALNRLLQRNVGIEEVILGEFDRLVEDLVGDGPIRVEGRAKIVLSVGKGVHGRAISLFHKVTPSYGDRQRRAGRLSPRIGGRVNRRPCPPLRSTAD